MGMQQMSPRISTLGKHSEAGGHILMQERDHFERNFLNLVDKDEHL